MMTTYLTYQPTLLQQETCEEPFYAQKGGTIEG
jgi:hypothetical protein